MRVAQEEIFGPIAVLMPFTDFDEVVRLSNDSIYGLAASVWTTDLSRAHRAAARLEAGTVWINTWGDMSAGILPFGGFKQAGIGREHGTDVIDAFTETKTVIVNLWLRRADDLALRHITTTKDNSCRHEHLASRA